MAQIILIESDPSLKDLLQINLMTYTGAEVIPRGGAREAIDFLKLLPSIDIVITTDRVGEEDTARILLEHVRDGDGGPVLVVLGDAPPHEKEEIVHIGDKAKWELAVRSCCRLLGIDAANMDSPPEPDYVPIPIGHFLSLDGAPCDIFARRRSSPTEFFFDKVLAAGGSFGKGTVEGIAKEGSENLYIPKGMEHYFTNFVSNHLVTELERKDLSAGERMRVMGEGHSIVSKDVFRFGFTTATIQLVESVLSSMMETVERIPKVNVLFAEVVNSKTGFLYQHAQMCCAVACACVRRTPLKDDGGVFGKLSFASFFQNVSLVEHEELARVTSQKALDGSGAGEELREKVLRHPLESGDLVKKYKDIPFGTDSLIRHHHGSPDGVGFSSDIGRLPELSRIFVLSSDLAHRFLAHGKGRPKGDRTSLIAAMRRRYSKTDARAAMRALEGVFSKERGGPL